MAEPAATTQTTAKTVATAGTYCKTCGYDLRASGEAKRCPECGRAFSPDDTKTFRRRPFAAPWKRALARWARRAAVLLLLLVLLLAGTWGWFYWGWRQDQAALAEFEVMGFPHDPAVRGGAPGRWLCDRHVPGSFVLERVREVCLPLSATDADLLPLRKLRWMSRLLVHSPKITDAGLAALRDLPGLERLDLSGVSCSDAGLAPLGTLARLEWLNLEGTPLTDAGLVHLARLSALGSLDLNSTRVTDAGLVHLTRLAALYELDLGSTAITDAGLVHLAKLRALKNLRLVNTQVTPAGVARLKAALPGCTIVEP